MDDKRASILEDLAVDAGRRRDEFLTDEGRKFVRFISGNKALLKGLGGLVLIDDEPDYLFVSEDGTFRSRTRYQDENGEWVAETDDIEDPADLVEIFNPADLYAAFVDAADAEVKAGEAAEAAESEDDAETQDDAPAAGDETTEAAGDEVEVEVYEWLDRTPLSPTDQRDAARLMYDLALTFQEGSQYEQARLLDDFADKAAPAAAMLGESKFVDDDDERLWLRSSGAIDGEVVPERDDDPKVEPDWQPLATSDDMVQFYDPTDLFGDLAEAIADSYPEVAPEIPGDDEDDGDDASDED